VESGVNGQVMKTKKSLDDKTPIGRVWQELNEANLAIMKLRIDTRDAFDMSKLHRLRHAERICRLEAITTRGLRGRLRWLLLGK
jgi:hypothetical protein